ncbi:uncharacterized protein SN13T_3287 [Lactiplantibacillus plantarum]|jgi:predicted GIY-YIG superfamily endonuclease|nr:uncharacterized protein SN13T_3287 [Lactiplantibacillus plantarum]
MAKQKHKPVESEPATPATTASKRRTKGKQVSLKPQSTQPKSKSQKLKPVKPKSKQKKLKANASTVDSQSSTESMAKQTADTHPADQVTVKQYYFYVLLCADATLYGGFTDNLERRLATHNAGKGAKYTRVKSRRPVKMIYHETFNDKSSALKAEYAFKHQSRAAKLKYLSAHDVKI